MSVARVPVVDCAADRKGVDGIPADLVEPGAAQAVAVAVVVILFEDADRCLSLEDFDQYLLLEDADRCLLLEDVDRCLSLEDVDRYLLAGYVTGR